MLQRRPRVHAFPEAGHCLYVIADTRRRLYRGRVDTGAASDPTKPQAVRLRLHDVRRRVWAGDVVREERLEHHGRAPVEALPDRPKSPRGDIVRGLVHRNVHLLAGDPPARVPDRAPAQIHDAGDEERGRRQRRRDGDVLPPVAARVRAVARNLRVLRAVRPHDAVVDPDVPARAPRGKHTDAQLARGFVPDVAVEDNLKVAANGLPSGVPLPARPGGARERRHPTGSPHQLDGPRPEGLGAVGGCPERR
mmetsp:Transcript_15325/g.36459  ORF Transcript_15325/g.36459 Transcript_15325/m.36459 type:complete len:250 (+) Transcript_15325:726-1475(+)